MDQSKQNNFDTESRTEAAAGQDDRLLKKQRLSEELAVTAVVLIVAFLAILLLGGILYWLLFIFPQTHPANPNQIPILPTGTQGMILRWFGV